MRAEECMRFVMTPWRDMTVANKYRFRFSHSSGLTSVFADSEGSVLRKVCAVGSDNPENASWIDSVELRILRKLILGRLPVKS
jgi:hypothetical protein